MENLDLKTLTAIASTIAALLAAYFTYVKTVAPTEKTTLYYEKVLLPFIDAYHKDCDKNWSKFLSSIIDRTCDYVPPYIFFLLEFNSNDNAKIVAVLLTDYKYYYKNDTNSIFHITDHIARVGSIIEYFAGLLLLSFSIVGEVFFILELFAGDNQNNSENMCYIFILFIAIFISISIIKFGCMNSNDDYILEKKKIEKKIKRKVYLNKKYGDKYYL